MLNRYINNSIFSVDNFFQGDQWLYGVKINDYQVVTIIWNLILIIVPFLIAIFLHRYWRKTSLSGVGRKIFAFILWFFWLLFIPNTAYVMSEVRHLLNYCPVSSPFQVCEKNSWMILFFFTYALIGWISYVLLLNQMKRLVGYIFGNIVSIIYTLLSIPIIALGFLMGLVHRWNSWEVFIYPGNFFNNLKIYWIDSQHFTNWLIFTTFLYILYIAGYFLFKERE